VHLECATDTDMCDTESHQVPMQHVHNKLSARKIIVS